MKVSITGEKLKRNDSNVFPSRQIKFEPIGYECFHYIETSQLMFPPYRNQSVDLLRLG